MDHTLPILDKCDYRLPHGQFWNSTYPCISYHSTSVARGPTAYHWPMHALVADKPMAIQREIMLVDLKHYKSKVINSFMTWNNNVTLNVRRPQIAEGPGQMPTLPTPYILPCVVKHTLAVSPVFRLIQYLTFHITSWLLSVLLRWVRRGDAAYTGIWGWLEESQGISWNEYWQVQTLEVPGIQKDSLSPYSVSRDRFPRKRFVI